MKVVLAAVNAKYIHSNLAVFSLRAYAAQHGQETEIAEYTINHQPEQILMDLYKRKPDVLAFSCYIWNFEMILELAEEFAQLCPGTQIWLGGPEVSWHAGELLEQHPFLRGIMRGEGEQTFLELVQYYRGQRESLEEIRGLTFAVPGKGLVETKERGLLSLDEVPFVYEDLQQFENRILYYETSRGCPFSCSYCLSSIDKRVRLRSFALVRRELDFFLEHRVPQVKFVDRTFNCNRKHSRQIWKYITEHDNGVTNFHFEISADLLEKEDLELFAQMRPGLIQLEIGVQSTNPDTIVKIHRHMDLNRLTERVHAVHVLGNIHQHLDLIAGLPGENYESFRRSYGDVYAMEPEQLQLGFLKVLKGSAMEEEAADYGIVYRRKPPYEVLYTRDLPYQDMIRLKMVEEMTEVYYNSGQFAYTLRQLVQEFENPFDLYAALGEYYERRELLTVSHSRIRRYDILLDFIREHLGAAKEKLLLYTELLTLDLYLRENVKSRPAWAADLSPYKEAAVSFYKKEEVQRRFLKSYEGFHAGQLARMTHLEVFVSPASGERCPVLFDYRNRNPLSGEAALYRLTKEDGYGDLYCD